MYDPLEALEDYLSNVETKSVEVKLRAGAKPLRLFYTPMTSGEMSQVQKKHPDFLNNQTVEGLVDLILMKAQDADGEKVFDLEDKAILMRQPVSVVSQVASALMGAVDDIEELEKN